MLSYRLTDFAEHPHGHDISVSSDIIFTCAALSNSLRSDWWMDLVNWSESLDGEQGIIVAIIFLQAPVQRKCNDNHVEYLFFSFPTPLEVACIDT